MARDEAVNDASNAEAASRNPRASRCRQAEQILGGYILPAGVFVLLSGLFWVQDRSNYHQLFYGLIALPAFMMVLLRPGLLRDVATSPVGLPFLAFASFTLLSILWSDTDSSALSLIKRPFYVALLFVGILAVVRTRTERLQQVLSAAGIAAVVAGIYALIDWSPSAEGRLSGYATLHNPLLTSHVFGFFAALGAAAWIHSRRLFPPVIALSTLLLLAVIVATGSRTPLVGIVATVIWLAALAGGRRGLGAAATLIAAGVAAAVFMPKLILERGLSYRPEIWREAWRQILDAPLLGHGYDAPLEILIADFSYAFLDPHNMLLAVLYYGGLASLALWCWLYGSTLLACWRQRHKAFVFICSAPLIYGLAASMTEGGSFLPRPKEHWFLIWIPFALLAAATLGKRSHDE